VFLSHVFVSPLPEGCGIKSQKAQVFFLSESFLKIYFSFEMWGTPIDIHNIR